MPYLNIKELAKVGLVNIITNKAIDRNRYILNNKFSYHLEIYGAKQTKVLEFYESDYLIDSELQMIEALKLYHKDVSTKYRSCILLKHLHDYMDMMRKVKVIH